jgi:hypothetical protein
MLFDLKKYLGFYGTFYLADIGYTLADIQKSDSLLPSLVN